MTPNTALNIPLFFPSFSFSSIYSLFDSFCISEDYFITYVFTNWHCSAFLFFHLCLSFLPFIWFFWYFWRLFYIVFTNWHYSAFLLFFLFRAYLFFLLFGSFCITENYFILFFHWHCSAFLFFSIEMNFSSIYLIHFGYLKIILFCFYQTKQKKTVH